MPGLDTEIWLRGLQLSELFSPVLHFEASSLRSLASVRFAKRWMAFELSAIGLFGRHPVERVSARHEILRP